jgi:alginate O-acetyltransferase complex protein AlgI
MTTTSVLTSISFPVVSPDSKGSGQAVIFSSFQYFLFLPVVLLLYWRLTGFSRMWLVVVASYFFYMSWIPVYGLLLFVLSTLSWIDGLLIGKYRESNPRLARGLIIAGIVGNLGCLCYYKYTNFLLENLYGSLGWIGSQMHLAQLSVLHAPTLQVILPLGISFFVFEFIHYLVDVYKGGTPVKSWTEFSAFAAFFPSQIAGPIKRYQVFQESLRNPLPWKADLFYEGMTLILQGLFKKVVIADPLGWVIAPTFAAITPVSWVDAWIAYFGFTLQIFCDFSGYTDIGRGSALLMGIRLPVNFNLPFLSESISEFWRRWHMSLASWIRDYIYIPLGGSRCSDWIARRNLFITFALCGLWHGAAWQFVFFGCFHGLALIVNGEWKKFLEKHNLLLQLFTLPPMRYINILLTFVFVSFTCMVFRSPTFQVVCNVLLSLTNFSIESNTMPLMVRTGVPVFASVYILYWAFSDLAKKKVNLTLPSQLIFPLPVRLAAWTGALLFLFAARPMQATPFIYFQF